MEEDNARSGPVAGLIGSLAGILTTLVGIAQTRLELVSTELQEEVERVAVLLAWGFVALFASGIGLFVAALALIFAFWETHRVLVAVLVVVFFFLLAAIAVWMLLARLRSRRRLFQATIAEFAKDREQLKARI